MISIKEAIIVEGKYDKIKLAQLVNTVILTTDGFGIFNDAEKRNVVRRLAEKRGIVILTDSDSAGFLIRNKMKGMLPPESVKHAYIPDVLGKEKRKNAPSKEGMLGVEGMTGEVLEKCLKDAGVSAGENRGELLTKADLYDLGLSGGENSALRRETLLKELNLPRRLSVNALLPVINALYTREEVVKMIEGLM